MRLAADSFLQCRDQTRLPDAGLARKQHQLAFALLCLPPTPKQQVQLFVAADQRGHHAGVERLEPAVDGSLFHHLPGRHWFPQTLQRDQSQISTVEEPTDLPARRGIDHHAVGTGKTLQARGNIRSLPDRRLLSRLASTDRFAYHHEAGGDPDAHLQ